jgi:hypothetical protein
MVATKSKKPVGPVPKGKAMAEKQEALLRTLSTEAQGHVERVREWFSREDRQTLKTRYALGVEIQALSQAQAKDATGHYGRRFVARLCEVFGWDKGVVYNALGFVRAYTREEIAALASQPMANGRLVPYGHLRALAKLPLKKDRDKLLKKAMAACWTRAELQDAILKATAAGQKKKEDGRGRPLKPPRDLPGLLRQQERTAQEFVRRATSVWAKQPYSLMAAAKKLPDKEANEDQAKRLREHAAMLRKLAETAGEQADEADRAALFLEERMTPPQARPEDASRAPGQVEKASRKEREERPRLGEDAAPGSDAITLQMERLLEVGKSAQEAAERARRLLDRWGELGPRGREEDVGSPRPVQEEPRRTRKAGPPPGRRVRI